MLNITSDFIFFVIFILGEKVDSTDKANSKSALCSIFGRNRKKGYGWFIRGPLGFVSTDRYIAFNKDLFKFSAMTMTIDK